MKRTFYIIVIFCLLAGMLGLASPANADTTAGQKKFLPVAHYNKTYVVTGVVTDSAGRPVAGVTVFSDGNRSGVTDETGGFRIGGLAPGEHQLAAAHDGYRFTPSEATLSVAAEDVVQNFSAQAVCADKIINGDFEGQLNNPTGWNIEPTQIPAVFTTDLAHTASNSAFLGFDNPIPGVNRYGHSQVSQIVDIPAGAESVMMHAWIYPTIIIPDTPGEDYDAQYIQVQDLSGNVLRTLMWDQLDYKDWRYLYFNLSEFAGQKVKLLFGVFNDNAQNKTAMYVDGVSLIWCPGIPLSLLAVEGTCTNGLDNSGFEYLGAWNIPQTEFPAGYSTVAHAGSRSMRTGILANSQNRYSYSDFWQTVKIPDNATKATLSMWLAPYSTVTTAAPTVIEAPKAGDNWNDLVASQAITQDAQYLLVLNPYNYTILETILWWQPKNETGWVYKEFNLLKYKGRSIRLQWGTYNNGVDGITGMFVDDAVFEICTGTQPPPPPPQCTEKIANGGAENNTAWLFPLTNYTAGYSTVRWHTGARSLRTGIVFQSHNRFSYSDAAQFVTIPAWAKTATLGLWMYPMSTSGAKDYDVQYILVLDRWGRWIDTLYWNRTNTQTWTYLQFNLKAYAGYTIILQFGSYNNGQGGVTSMYVDDVSLEVCP